MSNRRKLPRAKRVIPTRPAHVVLWSDDEQLLQRAEAMAEIQADYDAGLGLPAVGAAFGDMVVGRAWVCTGATCACQVIPDGLIAPSNRAGLTEPL